MTQPPDAARSTADLPAGAAGSAAVGVPAASRSWRGRLASVRLRIVGWYVLLVVMALASSLVVARQLLLVSIEDRLDEDLVQEAEELRALAGGIDPLDGEPFGASVDRLFEVFLGRNLPGPNETMITFVAGEAYLRSVDEPPLRLDQQADLATRWATVEETERGWVTTAEVGRVDYLAVPVRTGDTVGGVFVVAAFTSIATQPVDAMVRTTALVGGGAVLLGLLLAWSVSSRVLAPVRELTGTARAISDSDLSQRIRVTGDDELAELAATFNSMLDRLEEAFTGQRQFLDDAAHELRTPITIIQGHLELLEDDPAERAETLAMVLDELERMNRMVSDLLVLAQVRRPDFLQVSPVEVGSLLREVHSKTQGLAPRRWELAVDGTGTVLGDRQRLTQALVELAKNATQHTGQGDVVTLRCDTDATSARLEVRDTGPGVPAAQRERIFERFSRGEHRPRPSEGAGLGLSIVRAIAEAHGGRVELRAASSDEAGSTFAIVLPLIGRGEQLQPVKPVAADGAGR